MRGKKVLTVSSPLETKELIRQAVDIVDLVGATIQLRRQGRAYVGLCPWHNDTRPSLQVNPERQTFKCWVCDIGGDVFTFVMRSEGVDFREALQMLAERAGISLDHQRPAAGAAGRVAEKQTLYQVLAWAEQCYHRLLTEDSAAEPARKYLAGRGISQESIARFRIGYAPDGWDWLLGRARTAQIDPKVLAAVGLAVQRQTGEGHYDRFRGRVMFPIHDLQARAIAFGGRILPELAAKDPAKYINSPENPLFSKSEHLYGLDHAKSECAKTKELVVVEGYTDCVVSHQYGIKNVVAVLGTALGPRHIHLLRRYADSVVLMLDGDEAGRRRASDILELFVAMQMDLRILTLPDNLDPCDFLRAHGSEAFGRQMADAVDALEHKIRMVTQGLDPRADTHQANQALEEILAVLAKAPRLASTTSAAIRLRQEQILARLARWFRVPEEQVRRRESELRRRSFGAAARAGEETSENRSKEVADLWDRELLGLLLGHPEHLPGIAAAVAPAYVRSSLCRRIYQRCLELAEEGVIPGFDRLMLEVEDPEAATLLVGLQESHDADNNRDDRDDQFRLEQTLASFRRRKEDAENQKRIAVLRSGQSGAEEDEALDQLMATLRSRHRKSDPTDG